MKVTVHMSMLILILSMFLAGCGGAPKETAEDVGNEETKVEETKEVLHVFTTIFPLEDFTQKIGGEFVEVKSVIPVGADAHTFEPTPKGMIEIAEGDMFLYNGAGMEGFAEAVIDAISTEDVLIVQATEGITLLGGNNKEAPGEEEAHGHEDHGHEEEAHGHEEEAHGHEHDQDPHVWLDPILSIKLAENIKLALIELMPEQEAYFTSNFETVKEELEKLDEEFQQMKSEVANDTIIVSHAGYGYWENRYGIHQIGIAGISPTNEPSQKQLQNIIQLAEEEGIEYILFEQNISSRVAEVVQKEVGAEGLSIHNLEALVQADIDNNEDYFSLMRKNISVLKTALQ